MKYPEFLMLDETTSSLDVVTEQLVRRVLKRLLHGRTALVIAHRLETTLRMH